MTEKLNFDSIVLQPDRRSLQPEPTETCIPSRWPQTDAHPVRYFLAAASHTLSLLHIVELEAGQHAP
jgi:hypothetical protein